MSCSCSSSPASNGGSSSYANYTAGAASETTFFQKYFSGKSEAKACYMQRAGDPKNTPAGENKATALKTGILTYDLKSTNSIDVTDIILDDTYSVNVNFRLPEATYWQAFWILEPDSTGRQNIAFNINADNSFNMTGAFNVNSNTEGIYKLIIRAYNYKSNKIISLEQDRQMRCVSTILIGDELTIDNDNYFPYIVDQQTYLIRVYDKSQSQPMRFNVPIEPYNIPYIYANYGIAEQVNVADQYYNPLPNPTPILVDRPHYGVDLASDNDNVKILSSSDGVLTEFGYSFDYGNYVLIRHNNLQNGIAPSYYVYTLYGHMKSLSVDKNNLNKFIPSGTVLGIMGDTELPEGVPKHLHFEIRMCRKLCNTVNEMNYEYLTIDPITVLYGTLLVNNSLLKLNADASKDKAISPSKNDDTTASGDSEACAVGSDKPCKENPKIDPAILNSPDMNKYWLATMNAEVIRDFDLKYYNKTESMQGCPGGKPPASKRPAIVKQKGVPCGWNNTPGDRGGETKYGVATNFNKNMNMNTMTQNDAFGVFANKYAGRSGGTLIASSGKSAHKYMACHFFAAFYHGESLAVRATRRMVGMSGDKLSSINSTVAEKVRAYVDAKGPNKAAYDMFVLMNGNTFKERFAAVDSRCKKFFLGDS